MLKNILISELDDGHHGVSLRIMLNCTDLKTKDNSWSTTEMNEKRLMSVVPWKTSHRCVAEMMFSCTVRSARLPRWGSEAKYIWVTSCRGNKIPASFYSLQVTSWKTNNLEGRHWGNHAWLRKYRWMQVFPANRTSLTNFNITGLWDFVDAELNVQQKEKGEWIHAVWVSYSLLFWSHSSFFVVTKSFRFKDGIWHCPQRIGNNIWKNTFKFWAVVTW